MNRSTLIALLGLVVPFFGCQESGSASYPVSSVTRAQVDQIRERLTFIDATSVTLTAPPQEKPVALQVATVLKALHPALVSEVQGERSANRYRLLRPIQIGNYKYLELKPVWPVLGEITRVTYEDAVDSGFAILQTSFWKRVDRLQKNGMTIAFITSSPETVAGIYYADRPGYYDGAMIGIDLFANSGTLTHELRHAFQHQNTAAEPSWYRNLNKVCLSAAASYFGELDSTTVQLKSWIPVIESLPLMPKDAAEARRIGIWVDISLTQALSANLDYPVSAAQWVLREPTCAQELKDLVNAIVAVVYPQKARATGEELLTLTGLRFEATEAWQAVPGEATNARLQEIAARIAKAKQAQVAILREIAAERVTRLRALFREFERNHPEFHEDLVEVSGGYHLLTDTTYVETVGE